MDTKETNGMGLTIPTRLRLGGTTFYVRQGKVVGRASSMHEKRSNTAGQFRQRQKLRHTTALWKMLRGCEPMFTGHRIACQGFKSLAGRLPAVYVGSTKNQATFLMPGIPVSEGVLPTVAVETGTVDGAPALLTDLRPGDWGEAERLLLFTAVQCMEGDVPHVRFSRSELSRDDMTVADGRLALVGEEFADPMRGWALVRVLGGRCSTQAIVTHCTLYESFTTPEAMVAAAKTYGGLTPERNRADV